MRYRHRMPFGAEFEQGLARFRLWAPGASGVRLEVTHGEKRIDVAMQTNGDGWHSALVSDMTAGAQYKYRVSDSLSVPDPASRYNPEDVHGPSALVDPCTFEWPHEMWKGRPWEEAVIYELHVGTFTPDGTFNAAVPRLDYLVRLGITAIEIMPVADFPGRRNWGYDGVLPFAPDASYGTPDDLKGLVVAAHARGLMVILDVVYNHFGPEGNYLHAYAPQFFNARHQTPWGAAINFDGDQARTVRDYFIHNALYWVEEFNLDGLRLDAVHAIADDSRPDIVTEIAAALHQGPGSERHVHLILENDRNQARYLTRATDRAAPVCASAQWNDDFHHALHILTTGERDGYYCDYSERALWFLARTLAEGFAFQGEVSAHRGGQPRGEVSKQLPSTAFIIFTQTHDQVGNRAMGERIAALALQNALRVGVICFLLAPSIPMLFMGEEFAASTPFLFFCDFGAELATAVRDGRRKEFSAFERFSDPAKLASIPDPNAESTFACSKLKWNEVGEEGHHEWHRLYSDLLEIRRKAIVPHLAGNAHAGHFQVIGENKIGVDWVLGDGSALHLIANFSERPWERYPRPRGELLFPLELATTDTLPAWSALWTLEPVRA